MLKLSSYLKAAFCLSTLAVLNLLGIVAQAPSLKALENELKNLSADSLVVLDIDYTLIVPDDRILAPCGKEYFQKLLKQLQCMGEYGEILGSKVSLQSTVSVIDENIFTILKTLKDRQIKTIALTAMPTGKFGLISNTADWRINQLHLLGIDFDWTFSNIDSITLESFEGKKNPPVFKKGILASGKYPKGEVLVAFLKHVNLSPSKIVFVDDKMEFINSVETELDKEKIPHLSFHYTAATNQTDQVDGELANFQIKHLIDSGEWLNDSKAKECLKNNP